MRSVLLMRCVVIVEICILWKTAGLRGESLMDSGGRLLFGEVESLEVGLGARDDAYFWPLVENRNIVREIDLTKRVVKVEVSGEIANLSVSHAVGQLTLFLSPRHSLQVGHMVFSTQAAPVGTAHFECAKHTSLSHKGTTAANKFGLHNPGTPQGSPNPLEELFDSEHQTESLLEDNSDESAKSEIATLCTVFLANPIPPKSSTPFKWTYYLGHSLQPLPTAGPLLDTQAVQFSFESKFLSPYQTNGEQIRLLFNPGTHVISQNPSGPEPPPSLSLGHQNRATTFALLPQHRSPLLVYESESRQVIPRLFSRVGEKTEQAQKIQKNDENTQKYDEKTQKHGEQNDEKTGKNNKIDDERNEKDEQKNEENEEKNEKSLKDIVTNEIVKNEILEELDSFLSVHYIFPFHLGYASRVRRRVEVGGWGSVRVSEEHRVYNEGMNLEGEFSRIEISPLTRNGNYAPLPGLEEESLLETSSSSLFREPASPPAPLPQSHLLAEVEMILPAPTEGLEFFDFVGNITTSHAVRTQLGTTSLVAMHASPRFPLLGGWKTDWQIQYSLPQASCLSTFSPQGRSIHQQFLLNKTNSRLNYLQHNSHHTQNFPQLNYIQNIQQTNPAGNQENTAKIQENISKSPQEKAAQKLQENNQQGDQLDKRVKRARSSRAKARNEAENLMNKIEEALEMQGDISENTRMLNITYGAPLREIFADELINEIALPICAHNIRIISEREHQKSWLTWEYSFLDFFFPRPVLVVYNTKYYIPQRQLLQYKMHILFDCHFNYDPLLHIFTLSSIIFFFILSSLLLTRISSAQPKLKPL